MQEIETEQNKDEPKKYKLIINLPPLAAIVLK
jgi:hypothetical protein